MQPTFGDGIVDQPLVSAGGSSCPDRTYAAWLNTAKQLSMNSFATNDAVSSLGVAETSELPTRTTRLAVDQANAAYLLYKTRVPSNQPIESVSFRVRRSDDCGSSWNALGGSLGVRVHATPTVRSLYTSDFARLQPLGLTTQPRAKSSDGWISVHGPTGDVYVAHLDVTASGVSQIVMSRSTDKGQTWSSANITDGTTMSAYPEIAVNSEGVVGVLFIDFVGTGSNITFRHRLALSADKGVTWNISTLQTLSVRQLGDYEGVPELWGDFEALTTSGATFYGVFTGASIGRKVTELDPIFFSVIAHTAAAAQGGMVASPPVTTPAASQETNSRLPSTVRSYTVKQGDSLWRIARVESTTHRGKNWPALYDLNRKTIKLASLIRPRQVLQLPW
jgi:hypothetical protein